MKHNRRTLFIFNLFGPTGIHHFRARLQSKSASLISQVLVLAGATIDISGFGVGRCHAPHYM